MAAPCPGQLATAPRRWPAAPHALTPVLARPAPAHHIRYGLPAPHQRTSTPGPPSHGCRPLLPPPLATTTTFALSAPTSDWGVWAGLLAAAAVGMWSERTRLGRELSG